MLIRSRPKFITLGILAAMMALLIVGLMFSQQERTGQPPGSGLIDTPDAAIEMVIVSDDAVMTNGSDDGGGIAAKVTFTGTSTAIPDRWRVAPLASTLVDLGISEGGLFLIGTGVVSGNFNDTHPLTAVVNNIDPDNAANPGWRVSNNGASTSIDTTINGAKITTFTTGNDLTITVTVPLSVIDPGRGNHNNTIAFSVDQLGIERNGIAETALSRLRGSDSSAFTVELADITYTITVTDAAFTTDDSAWGDWTVTLNAGRASEAAEFAVTITSSAIDGVGITRSTTDSYTLSGTRTDSPIGLEFGLL